MDIEKTQIDGAVVLLPKIFGDNRGWFTESYSKRAFEQAGIFDDFIQDNRSFSAEKGTLRGLHCQTEPMAQAKLLTCLKGEILDVAVDIRKGSPTYMKWVGVKLNEENKKMFYIPAGCLHGFVTLTDNVEVMYKVNNFYSPENDRSVRFDDPALGVEWGITDPILSQKDLNAPLLCDSDIEFNYKG